MLSGACSFYTRIHQPRPSGVCCESNITVLSSRFLWIFSSSENNCFFYLLVCETRRSGCECRLWLQLQVLFTIIKLTFLNIYRFCRLGSFWCRATSVWLLMRQVVYSIPIGGNEFLQSDIESKRGVGFHHSTRKIFWFPRKRRTECLKTRLRLPNNYFFWFHTNNCSHYGCSYV